MTQSDAARPPRILISGGGGGVGLACAEALSAAGAELLLCDIEGAALKHGGGRDIWMVNNVIVKCGHALSTDARGPRVYVKWQLIEKLVAHRPVVGREPGQESGVRAGGDPADGAERRLDLAHRVEEWSQLR